MRLRHSYVTATKLQQNKSLWISKKHNRSALLNKSAFLNKLSWQNGSLIHPKTELICWVNNSVIQYNQIRELNVWIYDYSIFLVIYFLNIMFWIILRFVLSLDFISSSFQSFTPSVPMQLLYLIDNSHEGNHKITCLQLKTVS